MHESSIEAWEKRHSFHADKRHLEKKTLIVVIITFVMMIAEIAVGWLTNSMALYADGWHMGTHAFALGVSLIAYGMARRHARSTSFAFGTWKIEILGAYTSAIILGLVGLAMIYTSVERLLHPLPIQYNQAMLVAIVGLVVNVVCAMILNAGEHAHHHHEHGSHDHHHHDDLNLKSAYIHVVADALTSVLAITALLGAKFCGWFWLDPVMGIVGALLILRWAALLLRDSAAILLDHEKDSPVAREIKEHIESDGDTKIYDLHLWKVSDGKYACILAVVTGRGRAISEYRKRLESVHELAHTTIEIIHCPGGAGCSGDHDGMSKTS